VVLDEVGRVLAAAEKVQVAAARARAGLRKAQFVVAGVAIILAAIAVMSRRSR
jgi:hypothetical protein